MRHIARTLVLVGALAVAGQRVRGRAAGQRRRRQEERRRPAITVKGTVKSLDTSSLVVVAARAAT